MEILNIVGHNTKKDRVDYDFYPTPEIATLKLLEKESFKGDIWECACGDGAISNILKKKGYLVFNSDIVNRGFNDETIDFLNTDRKINNIITVKIVSTDNKGLIVRPEGCEMDFQIKKSAIAINAADARPSRWTGGEKLDCAIADLDMNKRKVTLSIRLLEEIEKKEALEKYGSEGSGKNLPFSSLSEDLKKKEEEKE